MAKHTLAYRFVDAYHVVCASEPNAVVPLRPRPLVHGTMWYCPTCGTTVDPITLIIRER